MKTIVEPIKGLLVTGNLTVRLVLVGFMLAIPSIWSGFFLDDHFHRTILANIGPLSAINPTALHLFTFADSNPEHILQSMESGFAPWWTSSEFAIKFWRPLAALTHHLDQFLWPDYPALMHFHNILWFILTIVMVTTLYLRLGNAIWPIGLAGFIFVVDESHGLPIAWIANRNAMLGLCFGGLSLLSHLHWRESGKTAWFCVAILALLLSLHSNEGGIATMGYLLAYACFLDKASIRSRILSLTPYVIAIVSWYVYYQLNGFGASGSPLYTDPAQSPLQFIEQLAWRLPVLLSAQLANLPPEPFEFLPLPAKQVFWSLACICAGGFLFAAWTLVRQSSQMRFWLAGMLLSLVPAATAFPSSRMLMFASIGGAVLVAEYIVWVIGSKPERGRIHAFICSSLIVIHLIVAPVTLVATSLGMGVASYNMDALNNTVAYPDDIEERTVFIVNSPHYFLSAFISMQRELEGNSIPKATHLLSPNLTMRGEMTITRIDKDTLRASPKKAFSFFLFRDSNDPFQAGDWVELSSLSVEVLSVNGFGQPTEVNYHFPEALESTEFYWLRLNPPTGYESYNPPSIGETHIL